MKSRYLIIFLFSTCFSFGQAPDWSVNSSDFQYTMNITCFLNHNGELLKNTNDKVGAFFGDELRGVANVVYNESVAKYVAYLTVLSNNPNETINFKIYDSKNNAVVVIDKTTIFEIDKVIGGIFQSYSIASPQLKSTSDLESFTFKEVIPSSIIINDEFVDIILPHGTNPTNLTPIFITKDNATIYHNTVKLLSDSAQIDFSESVNLQVLSEDESKLKTMTINVSIAQNSEPNSVVLTSDKTIINSNFFIINLDFSNEINALEESDVIITNGVLKEITKLNNKKYQAEIIALNNGDVQIKIPENTVLDINNTGNLPSNELKITYDKINPFIKEIKSENNIFTIIFSEEVLNISASDFEIKGVARDGFQLQSLEVVNASTYRITVTDLKTHNGSIGLNIKSSNTIVDNANNKLLAKNLNTFYIDNDPPIVVVRNFEVNLNGEQSVGITLEDVEISATDNIAIKTKELSKSTFTSADIGENNIDYSVTDIVGNVSTKKVVVTVVDTSLSIEDEMFKENINVYPNPISNNSITILSKNNVPQNILVFDANGRKILEKKTGKLKTIINFSELSSGVYFIKVETNGFLTIKKVLKR